MRQHAFRDGYKEGQAPQVAAFDPPPSFPGYLQQPAYAGGSSAGGVDMEALVKAITDQVLAAMKVA